MSGNKRILFGVDGSWYSPEAIAERIIERAVGRAYGQEHHATGR